MIIVQVKEGLGNQMFQYAFGRTLAELSGQELKLDLSWYDRQKTGLTRRSYELSAFNIEESLATSEEIAALKRDLGGTEFRKRAARLRARYLRLPGQTHVIEKHRNFESALLRPRKNVYCEGYWQVEKYFLACGDILRREFTHKQAPDGRNLELLERIKGTPSVSLHIRRGDYLTLSKYNVCSLDYYYRGIEIIAGEIQKVALFIFSDDIDWARRNFKTPQPHFFVDINAGASPAEDLRLMRNCRHHVIANSSFSWWGAWLAEGRDKIVIAPAQWRLKGKMRKSDRYPKGWQIRS
jgi:hypothetical protein